MSELDRELERVEAELDRVFIRFLKHRFNPVNDPDDAQRITMMYERSNLVAILQDLKRVKRYREKEHQG